MARARELLMTLIDNPSSHDDERMTSLRIGTVTSSPERSSSTRVSRIHAALVDGAPGAARELHEDAYAMALRVSRAGGDNDASDRTATCEYAAGFLARLGAHGILDPGDTRRAAAALSETCSIPLSAARFDLYLRTVSSPAVLALPPVVAAEIQLRLLEHLEIASEISLWRLNGESDIECIVCIGCSSEDHRTRSEARASITGRSRLHPLRRSSLRAVPVLRFGAAVGALVAKPEVAPSRDMSAYLEIAADALAPVLERELLLERNLGRERALLGNTENRLTRLGLDLHDGAVQDVLALGADVRALRDQVYPFVTDTHRELTFGRFDDLLARINEVDRQLRMTAHSLESRSIVARPLAEVLHREVESYEARTGIETLLRIQGDPESLSPQQRVAIFRAIQESLTNAREHGGASRVEVGLEVKRRTIVAHVTDNGHGFEVNRALALAAQRGRLGLVGMGERMRMLGGSLEIQSRPGGPTTLRFSLPLWEPFDAGNGGLR